MENRFTAVFQKEGEWWIGYVEELPGANTQGKTLEEVRKNLKEAVALIIEAKRELAEHVRRESEALEQQVLQLEADWIKGGLSDEKEEIRQELEGAFERTLQLLVGLGRDRHQVIRQIDETIVKKNLRDRFTRYYGELAKFLSSGFIVVAGATQEEMIRQLYRIIEHGAGLRNDAMLLFDKERYPTACFLSIVCIEECAKINFGWFQILSSTSDQQSSVAPHRRNVLNRHDKKHFIAACSGALVNSRMDRILGVDKVASFISDCETGNLEKLRQSCLYADINQAAHKVLLPMEQIGKEDALFYVCLAGEILAEAGGVEPSTHERLLEEVHEFEKENGMLARE